MQEGKADDIYYLKYQLSWLGKEYDERRWVSYTQQRNKIISVLDKYQNKRDGMLSEEQDSFARKYLSFCAVYQLFQAQPNRTVAH